MYEFKTNYDLYEYFMYCIGNRRVYLVRFSSILLLNFKKKIEWDTLHAYLLNEGNYKKMNIWSGQVQNIIINLELINSGI